jgi:hypothetical protein
MYRQLKNSDGTIKTNVIQRISDTAFIPCDAENVDYQIYLEWAKSHQINPPQE